jgi:hypothetical protein
MSTIKAQKGGFSVAREKGTTQKIVKVNTKSRGVSKSGTKEKVTLQGTTAERGKLKIRFYSSRKSQRPQPGSPTGTGTVKEFEDFTMLLL